MGTGGVAAGGAGQAVLPPPVCDRYASTRCRLLEDCLPKPEWIGSVTREEWCWQQEAALCTSEFELPGSSLDAAAVEACTVELEESDCAKLRGTVGGVLGCLPGPGTLGLDEGCIRSHQCESGVCRGLGNGCSRCIENSGYELPWLVYEGIEQLGEPPSEERQCKNPLLTLVEGLCQWRESTAPLATIPLGGNCGGQVLATCAPGLHCASRSDLGTGNCAAWLMEGEPCSRAEYWLSCEPGTSCPLPAGACTRMAFTAVPSTPRAGCE